MIQNEDCLHSAQHENIDQYSSVHQAPMVYAFCIICIIIIIIIIHQCMQYSIDLVQTINDEKISTMIHRFVQCRIVCIDVSVHVGFAQNFVIHQLSCTIISMKLSHTCFLPNTIDDKYFVFSENKEANGERRQRMFHQHIIYQSKPQCLKSDQIFPDGRYMKKNFLSTSDSTY